MLRYAIAASLLLTVPASAQRTEPNIRWAAATTKSADRVQLTLNSRSGRNGNSNWSSSYSFAQLRGLTPAQLRSARRVPVRFAIVREPGRIDCSGTASGGRGSGECGFAADAGFAGFLQQRGYGRPSSAQAFSMALSGVSRGMVDALAAGPFPRATADQLVALGIHGATPAWIRGIGQSGVRLGAIDTLIALRVHGADPAWLSGIAAAAPRLRRASGDDLLSLKIHGVTPQLVRGYAALGYSDLEADDLVQMKILGVTPEFIRGVQRRRSGRLAPSELVRLRLTGGY